VRAHRFLIAVLVGVLLAGGIAQPAMAAQKCQCLAYVAKVTGRMGIMYAYQAPKALKRKGYHRYWPSAAGAKPRRGDIVVMMPRVMGASSLGHIGLVAGWKMKGDGRMVVWLQSANWAGLRTFRSLGCSNVSVARLPWGGTFRATSTNGLKFFRR
jgi:hypothetical protein